MRKKEKKEFSKALLIWETVLIWVVTLSFIVLAYICIMNQYFGELTWLGAIYAFPWAAYGVSQACYYKKAEKENTKGGIKYDTVLGTAQNVLGDDLIGKLQSVVENVVSKQDDKPAEDVMDTEAVG